MSNATYPCYFLYKDTGGKWRWRYHATNGLIIAVSSEGYNARTDCERGIEIMKSSYASKVLVSPELQNAW